MSFVCCRHVAKSLVAGSREARFYAQARANRHICFELGVQFSTNLRKSLWTSQGPQGIQGQPKGRQVSATFKPKAPQRASQRDLNARPKGANDIPKGPKRTARGSQRHPKGKQREPRASQRETKGERKTRREGGCHVAKLTCYNRLPLSSS